MTWTERALFLRATAPQRKRVLDALNKLVELAPSELKEQLWSAPPAVVPVAVASDTPFVVSWVDQGMGHGFHSLGPMGIVSGVINAAIDLPDDVRLSAVFSDEGALVRFRFCEFVADRFYLDVDAGPLEQYRTLDVHRQTAREAGEEEYEDKILERMDVSWWEMTEEQQATYEEEQKCGKG